MEYRCIALQTAGIVFGLDLEYYLNISKYFGA